MRENVFYYLLQEIVDVVSCSKWESNNLMFHPWMEMSKMHFNQNWNEKQNIKYICSLIHLDILLLSLSSSRSFFHSLFRLERKKEKNTAWQTHMITRMTTWRESRHPKMRLSCFIFAFYSFVKWLKWNLIYLSSLCHVELVWPT